MGRLHINEHVERFQWALSGAVPLSRMSVVTWDPVCTETAATLIRECTFMTVLECPSTSTLEVFHPTSCALRPLFRIIIESPSRLFVANLPFQDSHRFKQNPLFSSHSAPPCPAPIPLDIISSVISPQSLRLFQVESAAHSDQTTTSGKSIQTSSPCNSSSSAARKAIMA